MIELLAADPAKMYFRQLVSLRQTPLVSDLAGHKIEHLLGDFYYMRLLVVEVGKGGIK